MQEPEISIVMPLYKGALFVEAALESVLSQSFENWECVCVDDGSRDGTGEVAARFAARDQRIRVLRQRNGGTSVARNTALDCAIGRYVAFLDEDDLYHPAFLDVLHSAAVRHDADIVRADFVPFDEGGRPAFQPPPSPDANEVFSGDGIRDLVADWYDGAPWEVWRHLYRRERITGTCFPAGVRVEQDLLWHYALLPNVSRYVHVQWAGYGWRRNSNGGVLNPRAESLVSEVNSFAGLAERLPRQMDFTDRQLRQFRAKIATWCKSAVVFPVRGGVRFSRGEFAQFKEAVRRLESAGVDMRTALGLRKRIQWRLFMATGFETFVRM